MNEILEINDNVLDYLFCLDENEKDDILQFLVSELAISQSKHDIDKKISDFRLIKILSFLLLGQKTWDSKIMYSSKDLDLILDLYDRAPKIVKTRLDDLMEILKIEIYGSID